MDPSSALWNNGNIDSNNLPMSSNDDFQFLDLDMGNMQFDFQSDFDSTNHMMHSDHYPDAIDAHMHDEGSAQLGKLDTLMHEQIPTTIASTHSTMSSTPTAPSSVESLVELDAQIQYLQQQRKQAQERAIQEQQRNFYAHSNMIPPTPTSFEMHPNYYPQTDQQRALFDPYQMRVKEQDMSFTPLVSPAVTPLDTHFHIPEYTTPGASFSPLQSPALHAQNGRHSVYGSQQLETSSGDMNIDSTPAPSNPVLTTRKSTRKTATKARSTRVRQSPIVKPQKKRLGSTAVSAQALADIIEPTSKNENVQTSSSAASAEASENGSISPEHLSDMAPPPLPRSTKASPYLAAQIQQQSIGMGNPSPATPASLMKMRMEQSPSQSAQQSPLTSTTAGEPTALETFTLPEPAKKTRPQIPFIDTQSDGQTTPTLESNGTKHIGFQPLPSPVFARPAPPKSTTQSPQIIAMSPSTTPARKTPQLPTARNAKKRSNTSSVQVSPALRPRISPSIKPLLPGGFSGGGYSDETASLLLASKSNYQNILEGTVIDGVEYPKELERGLTSKRTSHKIAEQGRRNRINTALQEIATLLPARAFTKEDGGDKSDNGGAEDKGKEGNRSDEKKGGAQNSNSKASTVELAIDYIKTLKSDLAEAKRRAEDAEKRLEQLAIPT